MNAAIIPVSSSSSSSINSSKVQERKESRRFHDRASWIATCSFLLFLAVMSVVFGSHDNNDSYQDERFLSHSQLQLQLQNTLYANYSCNAIFDTTLSGSPDQCLFAKSCNGGDGVFCPIVFCSTLFTSTTWCWILAPFLLLWMLLLFRMLGSTAEEFLSPSLEMFSFKLGLPPRFAGVSLLAFGNGAADVSATINAIVSDPNKGYQLSLGALSGAAMFIGCVVAGCVILVAKGVPCRGALVRDVMALLVTVLVVFLHLLSGTIGPSAISLFITLYIIFVLTVLLADIYHRTVVMPRQLQLAGVQEVARQQAAQVLAMDAAGDALIHHADMTSVVQNDKSKPPPPKAFSIVLTALSNYDNNPSEDQDGWGIDSSDLEHERPVHLHGRNGVLSSPQPTHLPENDASETHYNIIVEDGTINDRMCVSHPGAVTSTNWSGAWHDGVLEFKFSFIAMWEDIMTDGDLNTWEKILFVLEYPFTAARKLSIPIPCEGYSCRATVAVSVLCSPLWLGYYLLREHGINWFSIHDSPILIPWVLILLLISAICGALVLRYAPAGDGVMNLAFATPIALFGFIMAATWIDYIADHLVQLLDFLGIICKIPASIMGLTILAWGNSMGDLSANMTMARKGLANMAMTACFAGPVFNILIGLSMGFSALSAETGVLEHPVVLNPSIVTGFIAIMIHTISIIVIGTFVCNAHIPKVYGYIAIGFYLIYVATSFVLQFGFGTKA